MYIFSTNNKKILNCTKQITYIQKKIIYKIVHTANISVTISEQLYMFIIQRDITFFVRFSEKIRKEKEAKRKEYIYIYIIYYIYTRIKR